MKTTVKFVPNEDYKPDEMSDKDRPAAWETMVFFSEIEGSLKTAPSNVHVTTLDGERIPVEAQTVSDRVPSPPDILEKPTRLGERLVEEIESSELAEVVNPIMTHIIGDDCQAAVTVINSEEELKELENRSTGQ